MFAAAVLAAVLAQASLTYDAVTDRGPRAEPALVRLGGAGFSFNDPVFGSRIWRVTDRLTRPNQPDRSYRTPSATHLNAWSVKSSYFYVVSTDGTIVPFAFDPSSGAAAKLDPLNFYTEPQFSAVDDNIIFGGASGGTLRTIDQYDFSTGRYTRLLDLDAVVKPSLKGTFIGGIVSSAGPIERILVFFGGSSQDKHRFVIVFDKNAPKSRSVLDVSTLNFSLHHATLDRSGRYVMLYPTAPDLAPPRNAAQVYVWDTQTNTTTALPTAAIPGGHDTFGFGVAVNKDCCNLTTWDAAQWQIRSLAAPLVSRDLIRPILAPKETYLADHSTWNNARPDRLVPFITATYRYGPEASPWRAWDDEILAVQTDVSDGGAEVFRLAHHRSDVTKDGAAGETSFWYMPRPNVSQDGGWVLFTSNWEKTLGTDPKAPAGERARQDVFLLRLKPASVQ
jgi:hypothetical protein